MKRVAIAFSTKDRVELSRRTVEPLLQPDKFDLFWMDGSDTREGELCPFEVYEHSPVSHWKIHSNVRGGADAAIAYSLSEMLKGGGYDFIGLVENDVLLTDPDWFERTMELFALGDHDGLKVGAVSARCFGERILIQGPNYAIMHNLGAGMVIFTREAAELILKYFRTGWTNANRLLFSQLSGVDIGGYWAFRGGQHIITADWNFDVVLAAHGLASLALVPSPVEMLGQVPALAEQGLTLATGPVTERVNDDAFKLYRDRLQAVRDGGMRLAWSGLFHSDSATTMIFPHQLKYVGGSYSDDWLLKWAQGFGPFVWKAGDGESLLSVPVLGSCDLLVSGGKEGGKVHVVDKQSGFEATPQLYPEGDQGQVFALTIPSSCGYRKIELTALSPGIVFYGVKCREPQPYNLSLAFDHSWLPPCG